MQKKKSVGRSFTLQRRQRIGRNVSEGDLCSGQTDNWEASASYYVSWIDNPNLLFFKKGIMGAPIKYEVYKGIFFSQGQDVLVHANLWLIQEFSGQVQLHMELVSANFNGRFLVANVMPIAWSIRSMLVLS